MNKRELIERLCEYNADKDEIMNMSKEELVELLSEYEDLSDLYPNDDLDENIDELP